MVTDDIDHGRVAFLRVVDVGQRVAETRTQVQQRRRRFARHARIPVCRTAEHAFEQA